MKRFSPIPFATCLLLIGITAWALAGRSHRQRLAAPGVRLAHDPLKGGADLAQRTNAVMMPERIIGYQSTNRAVEQVELIGLPADTGFGRRFYWDDVDRFATTMSVVIMGTDRASLHRPELCLPSQGVVLTKRETVRLATADGDVEILKCFGQGPRGGEGTSEARNAVFAYFFLAANRQTSSHATRQLISLQDLVFRGEMPRWAMVTCVTWARPGEEEAAFEKMKRFLMVALPALRTKPEATSG